MKKYQVILCTGEITGPFDHIDLNELPPDAIRVDELALLPTGQFWLRGFQPRSASPTTETDAGEALEQALEAFRLDNTK